MPPVKETAKPKRAVKTNKKKSEKLDEDLIQEFAPDVEMAKYVVDVE